MEPSASETCLIVGTGHAGTELALAARRQGYAGRLLMVGAEPVSPYHRPPLSKAYLSGEKSLEEIQLRPPIMFEKANVELRLGSRIEAIDRAQQRILTADGEALAYDRLVLATGSRPRRLGLPGEELSGVHYLRAAHDVDAIRRNLHPDAKLIIVGGGYIGLEVASACVQRGISVTVLELAPRLLARVTAPEVSEFYRRVHSEAGVDVRTGVGVTGFVGSNGRVSEVVCADGTNISADVVIIGAGIVPETDLAEQAGLKVDDGIVIDRFGRTSDERILAAGDCTRYTCPIYQRSLRIESVPNAREQAMVAAASLCGAERAFAALPWFWSDQYDLKLQIAGLSQDYDQVVLRGDPETRSFAAFYLREGAVIAVDAVNRPAEFMAGKQLAAAAAEIAPASLSDETVPVKELLTING